MKKNNLYTELETIISKIKSKDYSSLLLRFNSIKEKSAYYLAENRELLIKSLIPVVIIGIGFHACSNSQNRFSRNLENIFAISDEIRLHYSNKADYWGLNSEYVVSNSILPNKFVSNEKIILSDGKELLVGFGKDGNKVLPRASEFDLILKNLNSLECSSYLDTDVDESNLIKLTGIKVINSKGIFEFVWGDNTYSLPIEKGAGNSICGDDNIIIWTVR